MKPFLELKNISYSCPEADDEKHVLNNISFQAEEGELIAVIGPFCPVCSVLLNLICGMCKPDTGEILLKGLPAEKTATNIGCMAQKDHLFEWRTIYSNITLGLELQGKFNESSKKRINQMMASYGLSDFSAFRPSNLSKGMRQRAALIRTLAINPDLLLLDDAFASLDKETHTEVCDDIYQMIKQEQKTTLLATHDWAEAISLADKIIVLGRSFELSVKSSGRLPSAAIWEIKKIIPISFGAESTIPSARTNTKEFIHYFNIIWNEMQIPSSIQ